MNKCWVTFWIVYYSLVQSSTEIAIQRLDVFVMPITLKLVPPLSGFIHGWLKLYDAGLCGKSGTPSVTLGYFNPLNGVVTLI